MFRLFRTARRPSPSSVRRVSLQLEALEGRALPSGFAGPSLILPVTADVKADIHTLSVALASNKSADIVEDLKELGSDASAVSADITAGKNAVKDIGKLSDQAADLKADLGKNAAADIKHDIHDLRTDLKDFAKDAARLSQNVNADLREDHGEITADVKAIAKDLASNKGADIVEDVKELQTDLAAVNADLAGGRTAIGDLDKLAAQQRDLLADLGKGASGAVKRDLHDLGHDVKDVTEDETAIVTGMADDMKNIQADLTKLKNQLGSGIGKAAAADLKALDAIMADAAADLKSGGDVAHDLAAAGKDLLQLISDVGGAITVGARETFFDISFNFTDLATDLASLKL